MDQEIKEQASKISEPIEDFIHSVEAENARRQAEKPNLAGLGAEGKEANQIAFWYEKIRTAIDYREEHLLRRAASRRILKRLFIFEGRRAGITDVLLKELVMGGYVKKEDLTESKFQLVDAALEKYCYALSLVERSFSLSDNSTAEKKRWLTTLASFEVEEILYPMPERRTLVNAMFKILSPRVDINQRSVTDQQKDFHVYIAIYRSLMKADRAMVASEIFNLYFPEWMANPAKSRIEEIMGNIDKVVATIYAQATDEITNKVFHALKKQTFFASILCEIAEENKEDIRGIVSQEYILREFVKRKVEEHYDRVNKKLQKRISRGIIYIFITKMLLALVLEVPYEKYFEGAINYTALAINLFFPPAFMVFLAKSAKFPTANSVEATISGVESLVYDTPHQDDIKKIAIRTATGGFTDSALNVLYFFVFTAVFGGLIWTLHFFDFDIVSGGIFFLFMCTVSFFGALIRQSVRDLSIVREKEGLFSLFFDTMLLPFVRFGRWLSTNFSKVNVFMFLLDVIIEAPFKMIIRLFEAWIDFLRRKREEIDQQFG